MSHFFVASALFFFCILLVHHTSLLFTWTCLAYKELHTSDVFADPWFRLSLIQIQEPSRFHIHPEDAIEGLAADKGDDNDSISGRRPFVHHNAYVIPVMHCIILGGHVMYLWIYFVMCLLRWYVMYLFVSCMAYSTFMYHMYDYPMLSSSDVTYIVLLAITC